jgi:hypothetical protein
MPGGRPRMTARDLSAQTRDLPPGKVFPMCTTKLMFCQGQMGMRCKIETSFLCLNRELEPFMLMRGMTGQFSSRHGKVVDPLGFGRMQEA